MNRKITRLAIAAFLEHRPFHSGNTSVVIDGALATLFLHDNAIAKRVVDGADLKQVNLSISTAGWDTTTTKARLNGLPSVRVFHAKRELYLNGAAWNGEWKAV